MKKKSNVVFEVKKGHVVLFLCIVVLIAMMALVAENVEYASIIGQRISLATTVARGEHRGDELEEDYMDCQERFDHLRNSSAYGAFLANQEQNGGKVLIAFVILVQIAAILFSLFFIWAAVTVFCEKAFKRFMRKLYCFANAKSSRRAYTVRRKNK